MISVSVELSRASPPSFTPHLSKQYRCKDESQVEKEARQAPQAQEKKDESKIQVSNSLNTRSRLSVA
ncbi:hypothetical protein AAFC00_003424 [Neodothiora populina]|uniref:Uncharacterized protein n=1 Tax=Neodothiora populina TaxID=2781224 RepID=A0ABR3PE72_9PEZI